MSEYSIGTHPAIDGDITALGLHIRNYRTELNDKGIWLFLATLGCWSVSNTRMQVLAFLATLLLFFAQMMRSQKEKRTITSLVGIIRNRIAKADLDNESRNNLLFDLKALQDNQLSIGPVFRDGIPFVVSWVFLAFSFYSFPGS